MPSKRVIATIGGRETIVHLEVPDRHFTETPQRHAVRVSLYLEQRLQAMGATKWQEDYATDSARKDSAALETLLRARRANGQGASFDNVLSFRREKRKKRQKYPRH